MRLKDLSYHIICGFFYVVLVFCLQTNMKTGKLLSPFVCIGHLCNLVPKSNIKTLGSIHARRQVHFFMMAELTLVLHKIGRNEGRGEDRV